MAEGFGHEGLTHQVKDLLRPVFDDVDEGRLLLGHGRLAEDVDRADDGRRRRADLVGNHSSCRNRGAMRGEDIAKGDKLEGWPRAGGVATQRRAGCCLLSRGRPPGAPKTCCCWRDARSTSALTSSTAASSELTCAVRSNRSEDLSVLSGRSRPRRQAQRGSGTFGHAPAGACA